MKPAIISIVIPCLNEVQTIWKVIQDTKINCQKYLKNHYEILVADNGSTDGSLKLLKRHRFKGVIHVPTKGYGAALHYGISKARGKYIIYADADCSYPFANLVKFKETILQNPDLVLGSRLMGKIQIGAMPPLHRYLGTPVLTFLIRMIYGIPTTDCNSGMRMVKKSFYKTLNMRNSGMEWASELLLKTALKKGKYVEVPITFKKDQRTHAPHLSTWADGWRHLKAIVLLKPECLYPLLIALPGLSIFFYKSNFTLSFLSLLLSIILILVLLTLELLESAIEQSTSLVSDLLKKFKLVPFTMLISLLVAIGVFSIPESHLGSKLFLASLLGVIFMWIFLIETIKTHLVNRLPNL